MRTVRIGGEEILGAQAFWLIAIQTCVLAKSQLTLAAKRAPGNHARFRTDLHHWHASPARRRSKFAIKKSHAR